MAGSFVAYRTARLRPPLSGPQGETWAAVLGAMQDRELALLRAAALSRFPATCPDDGLDLLGQAYQLPRLPGETHASYRGRLQNAWPTYDIAGSPDAVVASLRAYGIPDVQVIREEDGGWPSVWYSRFTVKLGPNLGILTTSTFIIGQGIIGQTPIGIAFTDATQRAAVKGQILRWKATHGYAADILIDASAPGGVLGRTFIGRLIGLNFVIGQTPIGGYDRS